MREHYAANRKRLLERRAKKFALMRAAKELIRMERALREEPLPDASHVTHVAPKPSGFEVTIRCLDDGERVTLRTVRLPWGLSLSPTEVGRRVAAVLRHYQPANACNLTPITAATSKHAQHGDRNVTQGRHRAARN